MRKFVYVLLLVSFYLAKVVYAEEVVIPDAKLLDNAENNPKPKKIVNIRSESSNMEDRKFYLKAMADRGFFRNSKVSTQVAPRKHKDTSVANSSDFGLGYYFNNEFRGEILYHREYNNKFVQKFKAGTNNISRSFKNDIDVLMVGLNMSVVDFDYGNLFLLGNLGVARVKEKFHQISNNANYGQNSKAENSFAYGVGIGADFKLSERLHAEIAYRFNDYGKTKSMKNRVNQEVGKLKLQSHNALVGLRMDM